MNPLAKAILGSTKMPGRCIPAPFGCGKPITTFKDERSSKEYLISGMCQECQDAFFCSSTPDCNKPCCKDEEEEV